MSDSSCTGHWSAPAPTVTVGPPRDAAGHVPLGVVAGISCANPASGPRP
ncbi:hypothetical protein [Trinickia mobilis]|nr:hypothetical protein [Trinickia mobilis]